MPRAADLAGESAFSVHARALELERCGRSVIHLHLGQPEFPTPPHVLEAGVRALGRGETRYAPAAGVPALRAAIAERLRARGVPVTPDRVVVTPGGKAALHLALAALVADGVDVLVPDPGFPSYAALTRFLGGRPVPYRVRGGHGAVPHGIAEAITPATRVLVVNTPHNPTGTALEYVELERIAELAERHALAVISDEVYGALQFDGGHCSLAAVPGLGRRTLVVDSLSKTHAMTGWRLGYVTAVPALSGVLERLATHTFSCTATFVQHAGLAALEGPQSHVTAMRAAYARRTARVADLLDALPGVRCPRPAGAFYVFPDVRGAGEPVERLAARLLEDHGVAVLDGAGFGAGGTGCLRVSCAGPPADLAEGVARIRRALEAAP